MDHPVKDIRNVLRTLTQGSPEEQHDAIIRYFTPSASFIHPFCRVPSFSHIHVPLSGGLELNSRMLVLAIYKWYKILSPHIDLEIESTVFDQRAHLLYLTLRQTFSIWFLPFHRARAVRLVTVLHLVPEPPSPAAASASEPLLHNGVDAHHHSPSRSATPLGNSPSEPTFAEVASTAVDTSGAVDAATGKPERRIASSSPAGAGGNATGGGGGGRRYRIDRQEDLYQVNEFLKFVAMTPGAVLYGWWQLWSTALCLLGVVLLGPVVRVAGLEGQRVMGGSGARQTVGEKR